MSEFPTDTEMLDWLASLDQNVGNVMLPREFIRLDLRESITETMRAHPVTREDSK